jgi:hypothetical protein
MRGVLPRFSSESLVFPSIWNAKSKICRSINLPANLHGCKTWPLTIKGKHKLKASAFEKRRVLRSIGLASERASLLVPVTKGTPWPESASELEKINYFIGNRTRGLPAHSVAPKSTTLPRAPSILLLCFKIGHYAVIYLIVSTFIRWQQNVSHPWHEMPRAPTPRGSGWRHPRSREVPFAMFVLSGASGCLFVWWNEICKRWDDDWGEEHQYSRQSRSQPSCKLITWLWIPWAPSSTSRVVRINPSLPLPRAHPYQHRAVAPSPSIPAGCSIWLSLVTLCLPRKERTRRRPQPLSPYFTLAETDLSSSIC